jgi:hypothetical protein
MPTTLRFLFLLLLGLLGFRPFSNAYDAVGFVSSAEQCTYASTIPIQAAAAKSAVSLPLFPDGARAASTSQADLRPTKNFIAAETGTTTLYRAVGPAELADIDATSALRNLGSAEGKYFTTSAADASSYAKQAVNGFGDPPYTIIKTEVPNTIFEGLTPATVDRGIPAWVVPNNRLPGLTPIIEPSMPIPPLK